MTEGILIMVDDMAASFGGWAIQAQQVYFILFCSTPKIKVLSVENPELTNALSLKAGVGHNIAKHASAIATNSVLS